MFPFPLPRHKPFFPAFHLQQAWHPLLNYKKKGKAQGTPLNSCAAGGLFCRQVVRTFSPNLVSKLLTSFPDFLFFLSVVFFFLFLRESK